MDGSQPTITFTIGIQTTSSSPVETTASARKVSFADSRLEHYRFLIKNWFFDVGKIDFAIESEMIAILCDLYGVKRICLPKAPYPYAWIIWLDDLVADTLNDFLKDFIRDNRIVYDKLSQSFKAYRIPLKRRKQILDKLEALELIEMV